MYPLPAVQSNDHSLRRRNNASALPLAAPPCADSRDYWPAIAFNISPVT